jgi:hypothetical protein
MQPPPFFFNCETSAILRNPSFKPYTKGFEPPPAPSEGKRSAYEIYQDNLNQDKAQYKTAYGGARLGYLRVLKYFGSLEAVYKSSYYDYAYFISLDYLTTL